MEKPETQAVGGGGGVGRSELREAEGVAGREEDGKVGDG